MISPFAHFTTYAYNDAWRDRPHDILAYIMYANARLDGIMRRKFRSLYTPSGEYHYLPLLDELARAEVIISRKPWQYAQFSLPRTVSQYRATIARDHRYSPLVPVDVDHVMTACKLIAGATVRDGYRSQPNTFAQFTPWNYDGPDDAAMCALKWAEEDWEADLLVTIETIYYQLMEMV